VRQLFRENLFLLKNFIDNVQFLIIEALSKEEPGCAVVYGLSNVMDRVFRDGPQSFLCRLSPLLGQTLENFYIIDDHPKKLGAQIEGVNVKSSDEVATILNKYDKKLLIFSFLGVYTDVLMDFEAKLKCPYKTIDCLQPLVATRRV
jgi:hypothetical protein